MTMRSRSIPVLHLLALSIGLLLALPCRAAEEIPPGLANSTPEQRAKAQTLVMKEKLGLTEQQLPKVEAINLQAAQKMEPVLKGNERPLMKLQAMKSIEQEKEAALQGVFTPAQFQQFQAAREEIKQKVEQRLMEKKTEGGAP
jgi:hypothetical protein